MSHPQRQYRLSRRILRSGGGRRTSALSPNEMPARSARQFTPEEEPAFYVDAWTPEVTIGVAPDTRGQGIGRRLLLAVMGEAARGVASAYASTFATIIRHASCTSGSGFASCRDQACRTGSAAHHLA
jgi:GNAT superfamily N-acetyltransferase